MVGSINIFIQNSGSLGPLQPLRACIQTLLIPSQLLGCVTVILVRGGTNSNVLAKMTGGSKGAEEMR